jgi:hypothetical protein
MKKVVSVFLAVVVFAFASEKKLNASRTENKNSPAVQTQQLKSSEYLPGGNDISISKQVEDNQIINL